MHILVTRPLPYGPTLCTKINRLNMHAIYYPTLAFFPPQDDVWQQQLLNINAYQWLIFTSRQAVIHSVAQIKKLGHLSGKIAAIGSGTMQALQETNLPIDCYPPNDWSSEGLLNLSPFQQCESLKIALIKGEGGRQLLNRELTLRGALVTEINCYRRCMPKAPLLNHNTIDVIIITSVESLQNFKKMTQDWQAVVNKTLIVISERIKIFAEKLGFKKVFIAENASDEAILNVLSTIN